MLKLYHYLFIIFIILSHNFIFLSAEEHGDPSCRGSISLIKIVKCVLDHSPEYKIAKLEMKVLEGQKKINSYLFPSNPIISFYSATRTKSSEDNIISESNSNYAINGQIHFSQEIYLTSKRKLKMNITEIDKLGQNAKIVALERETIAGTISTAIQYEYSKRILVESEKILESSEFIKKSIKKRVEKGLLPPIDLDLADSENIKMIKMVQNAKRTKESYKANLTVMMGVPNDSELVINDLPESFKIDENKFPELLNYALINRPEIFLNEKEILSLKKRTELLFMDKVPNLTIGGFAQRDGFNENVIGASISLPLKVWRNNSGEIQENIASTEKAISRGEIQKHSIKYEIINAISKYTSYKNELNSFSDDLINRIDLSLEGLQKAVTTGQIQIREALLTRQSLINLKLSHLESRRDILLSGIELIRASGLPFLHGEKEIEN